MLCSMRHGRHTRRDRPDPLLPTSDPTWLVTRNALSEVVEVTPLEPHADLRTILTAARDQRIAVGWDCEEIGTCLAFFFCRRNGERLFVAIERREPPPVGQGW